MKFAQFDTSSRLDYSVAMGARQTPKACKMTGEGAGRLSRTKLLKGLYVDFSISSYLDHLAQKMSEVDQRQIEDSIALIQETWEKGRKTFVCGNGGSALTASHFVHEWNKNIHHATGRVFRGHCLSDNVGLVTAYGNDMSYDDIFAEQLKNMMDANDLLIVLSGSGNSENVIRALQYANENDANTLAICGFDGGKVKQIAQSVLWIPSFDMQICEDLHFVFGHMVMKALCGIPIRT